MSEQQLLEEYTNQNHDSDLVIFPELLVFENEFHQRIYLSKEQDIQKNFILYNLCQELSFLLLELEYGKDKDPQVRKSQKEEFLNKFELFKKINHKHLQINEIFETRFSKINNKN
ncbi:MAG: hypothetical protein NE327_19360 [Lentisphaeraceae bacterium]|nr:hypothetical protein [Lentisphaeraceae bacterium]